MRDPKLYIFTLLQHASLLTQTFQYFFPTVIETLGYGTIETLLITAPVWIATFLVGLLVTWTSGKTGDRSIHIMCLSMISCIGNIICIATLNIPARFFAIFLMPVSHCTSISCFPPPGTDLNGTTDGRRSRLPNHYHLGRQLVPPPARQTQRLHLLRQHGRQ